MQTIAIIGCGAIGEAVAGYLADHEGVVIAVVIIKPGKDSRVRELFGEDVEIAHTIDDVVTRVDLVVDCAGHPGLRQHGARLPASVLRPGYFDNVTLNTCST